MLKDEPRFEAEFMGESSKRSKVSVSSGYLPSSSLGTPIEVEEYDMASMSRPIGQKAAKRKNKGKGDASASNNFDLSAIESVMKEKNVNTAKLIELKESQEKRLQEQEKHLEYGIL